MVAEPPTGDSLQERIEDVDVVNEMETSYVDYAISVIHARALPDARDGLKPVQRRILYQMQQMGLTPDKPHVKSARVVGDVMGKLHPHGDSAIYDALVRLARPFAMSAPLVDGHGNFGSLDDGPAASRYTEARLTSAALLLTQDLDEDVVDFVPNYDGQYQQPSVLPAAFPNLLVNGTSGIAVGMATNMAPHNPIEAITAAQYLLMHPSATLDELMTKIPGPDLPSGGMIVGLDGIRDAYATGRGTMTMRAKATVEQVGPRRRGIVVTELPYMVGPEQVIQKIKDAVQHRKLDGIRAVHDLTDRANGLKLVIEIKTGIDPDALLRALYRHTPLETNFSMNNVVLVNNQPQTLGLRDLLSVYLDHRLEVTRRRSEFRRTKARERLHLVEGLLIALVDIDEVIAVIRSSDTAEIARQRLMAVFDLSELQAEYILQLRLRRLTKLAQLDLEAERDELQRTIAALDRVLGSPTQLRQLVHDELGATLEQLSVPRRTALLEADGGSTTAQPGALSVADAPCTVVIGTDWSVVRTDPLAPASETGSSSVLTLDTPVSLADGQAYRGHFAATTSTAFGVVLRDGSCHRVAVADLPLVPSAAIQTHAGLNVASYLGVPPEQVVGVIPLDQVVALGTANGIVKRVTPDWPKADTWELIALKDRDTIVAAAPASDADELVFVTRGAQLLRFTAATVRPQGRAGGGVAGIKLQRDDVVLQFAVVRHPSNTVVVTRTVKTGALPTVDPGLVKCTPYAEFPAKGRATGGVRAHRFVKGYTELSDAWIAATPLVCEDADFRALSPALTYGKRDGSGQEVVDVITAVGSATLR